jgi:hypothetical protein
MKKLRLCLLSLSLGLSPLLENSQALAADAYVSKASETSTSLTTATVPRLSPYALRALPWGNLFYQLDCLAGQGHCSQESYRALWQTLSWDAEDEKQLDLWKALRQRYAQHIQFETSTERTPLPSRFEGMQLWDKIRLASLNAQSPHELKLNLQLVMHPQDAEQLMAVLLHFNPRFLPWWQSEGEALSRSGLVHFESLLQQKTLPAFLSKVVRFYEAKLTPESLLAFNFMARPQSTETTSNGEQIESQSVVEVVAGKAPGNKLDVVVHELCHYLYRRSRPEAEQKLLQWFASQPGPEAIVAYNLLNEVLATSIGNALINQWQMSPGDFQDYLKNPRALYNDPWIAPVAKAVYPRVKQALDTGESLYALPFLKDYLQLTRQALGPEAKHPVPLLRTMAAAYTPETREAFRSFQRQLRIGSVWGNNSLAPESQRTFKAFSALSGAIFVTHDQQAQLKTWEPLLGKAAIEGLQAPRDQIWGIATSPNSFVFVFMADNDAGFDLLIQRFLKQNTVFEGPL